MKRPSERTWQLLNEFYSGQGLWNSLIGKKPSVDFLDEIAASGEQLVISHLAPMLLHRSENVRVAAAHCISKIIIGIAAKDFPQLEQSCRNDWAYDSSALHPWRTMKPSELPKLFQLPSSDFLLGLASFHNNGYVRESALEMLTTVRSGIELPFVLLRLNDWVPQVRRIAADAISARLETDYASRFIRNLWLVSRLRSCGRGEHELVVNQVTSLLASAESPEALTQGILSADPWTRRESFQIALAGTTANHKRLLDSVLHDADPILRLWAIRAILPKAAPEEARRYLQSASADKFRPVRCEALNLWASRFPDDATDRLEQALFDSHGSVRSLAQFWMKKLRPEVSVAEVYREVLARGDQTKLRAAILGVGETGEKQDAARVAENLNAGTQSLQKAAIRSLASLDREAYTDRFFRALSDDEPGISNEAARALRPLARRFHDQLLPVFRESRLPHTKRNVFRLLQTLPFWRRGIFLFEAIRDSDEHIVKHALNHLRTWIDRSGGMPTPPSPDELAQLQNALKASSGMLSEKQVQVLNFSFRTLR